MHILQPMPRPIALLSTCFALLLLSAAGMARADEVDEVARLFRTGQASEALARAERFLADKPGDAAMRFQKGVMLSELGRSDEAIDVFTRLTQDYPDLPEPYNNLGVLLAARGEYERARVALEAAVRNNPGYGVAHENLGDIHVAIAGQEYARAIALASRDTTARPKLELIRELLSRAARGAARTASGVPAS
jgi:Flp pilus assembly protein TadD